MYIVGILARAVLKVLELFNVIIFIMTIKVIKDQLDNGAQRGKEFRRGKKNDKDESWKWGKEDKRKLAKSTFIVTMTESKFPIATPKPRITVIRLPCYAYSNRREEEHSSRDVQQQA
ncbi:hypothetical protein SK128_020704 [Halocaridina rubra]|uniref:Uncharacterized protein n=1 Tax=Halocaridina rubra TaxID=373956 RepID=A0AAN9A727_HALRR